ncbi:MAG: polysaccharide biosynthesis tyrosine autokinase [Spirochaetales bacterium]|nr:polysaccharide biosynthesis tyrosine autokinase [Spirochaetales bacterium]
MENRQIEDDEIDLLELVKSCFRHKLMIALFFVVAVAAAVGYLIITVPTYEASVTIMVKPINSSTASLTSLIGGSDLTSSKIATEIELMKSRLNLNNALAMLNLDDYETRDGVKYSEFEKPLTAKSFTESVTVSSVKDTNLVSITVKNSSPEFARDYANALATSYNNLLTDIARTATQTSLEFLENQIPQNLAETEKATKALAEFQVENNIMQVTQDSKEALLSYNYLIKRKAPLLLEIGEAEAIIAQYPGLPSYETVIADEKVRAYCDDISSSLEEILRYDLLQLSTQTTAAKTTLNTNQENRYFNLNQSVDSLKKEMSQYISDSIDADLSTALAYAKAMTQKIAAEVEVKLLDAEAERNSAFLETVPEIERQLSDLQTQVEIYTQMSVALMQMLQEAKLKESAISDNVSEIDMAELPEKPIAPKKAMILMAAAVLGAGLGCLLAIVIEFTDKSIYTVEQLKELLPADVPFLGWIPMIKRKEKERYFGSVVLRQPNSFESEKYKHIASTALFGTKKKNRVISVCSSGMNIGKTSVMVNLAVVFAQQGKKVLLIDGDLRMPSCESFFNLEHGGLGFVDVLVDDVPLEECIVQPVAELSTLHLLPCGTKPKVPSIVFAQESFPAVMEKLRGMYDIVMFDAPPVNFAAEFMDIVSVSDEVLIVARAGITQKEYMSEVIETVKNTNVRITGVCLNAYVDQKGGKKQSYGYGYEYYSGSGSDSENISSIVKKISIFTSRRSFYRRRYKHDLSYRSKRKLTDKLPRIYPFIKEEGSDT